MHLIGIFKSEHMSVNNTAGSNSSGIKSNIQIFAAAKFKII